ncbi:MAG: acylphosphatase [Thermoproteota archaeon]
MTVVRAHLYISGRVQGVFFRYETKAMALKLGVNGWVRNLPTGQVEALLEGEKENVEKLIEFCRKGPPGAHVTQVEVRWESPMGDLKSFMIKY